MSASSVPPVWLPALLYGGNPVPMRGLPFSFNGLDGTSMPIALASLSLLPIALLWPLMPVMPSKPALEAALKALILLMPLMSLGSSEHYPHSPSAYMVVAFSTTYGGLIALAFADLWPP